MLYTHAGVCSVPPKAPPKLTESSVAKLSCAPVPDHPYTVIKVKCVSFQNHPLEMVQPYLFVVAVTKGVLFHPVCVWPLPRPLPNFAFESCCKVQKPCRPVNLPRSARATSDTTHLHPISAGSRQRRGFISPSTGKTITRLFLLVRPPSLTSTYAGSLDHSFSSLDFASSELDFLDSPFIPHLRTLRFTSPCSPTSTIHQLSFHFHLK